MEFEFLNDLKIDGMKNKCYMQFVTLEAGSEVTVLYARANFRTTFDPNKTVLVRELIEGLPTKADTYLGYRVRKIEETRIKGEIAHKVYLEAPTDTHLNQGAHFELSNEEPESKHSLDSTYSYESAYFVVKVTQNPTCLTWYLKEYSSPQKPDYTLKAMMDLDLATAKMLGMSNAFIKAMTSVMDQSVVSKVAFLNQEFEDHMALR